MNSPRRQVRKRKSEEGSHEGRQVTRVSDEQVSVIPEVTSHKASSPTAATALTDIPLQKSPKKIKFVLRLCRSKKRLKSVSGVTPLTADSADIYGQKEDVEEDYEILHPEEPSASDSPPRRVEDKEKIEHLAAPSNYKGLPRLSTILEISEPHTQTPSGSQLDRGFIQELSESGEQISPLRATMSPELKTRRMGRLFSPLRHSLESVSSNDSLTDLLLRIPSPKTPDITPSDQGDSASLESVDSTHVPTRLDKASTLFFLRQRTSLIPRILKPELPLPPPVNTAINPWVVGPAALQEALRENTRLDDELRADLESLPWINTKGSCPCQVFRHPPWWSDRVISDVHNYSFLLDYKRHELRVLNELIVAANSRGTLMVLKVPMTDGYPWKTKAEQVLRYMDVECGAGDGTAYDLHYYKQPCDREMLLLLSDDRVVGLVLAEETLHAYRILIETVKYRELAEDPVPVRLGINRLWIHVSMRHQHLATQLCLLAGQHFKEGVVIKREDYAFNSVSDSAVAFAKVFQGTFKALVYNGKIGVRH